MMERRAKHTPYAKKSLGQNFLVDQNYIDKIVNALELFPLDTVIEIGPGRGALTERLLELSKHVVAVELDRDMVAFLMNKFSRNENLEIVQSDVLLVKFSTLLPANTSTVKLVANLPYYISTTVLQRLIEQRSVFNEMILMFQREVVGRITAAPGSTDRGFLTVLVEAYLAVEKLFDVPPTAFSPVPKVWSSAVRLRAKNTGKTVNKPFVSLISAGFSQKRKTILNNLKGHYSNSTEALRSAGVDPQRRAETLTLEEWFSLLQELV